MTDYEKKRDESAKDIDDSRDDLSCHTCFIDGADWSRSLHLAEIEKLKRSLETARNQDRRDVELSSASSDIYLKLDAALMRENKLLEALEFYADKTATHWLNDRGNLAKECIAENQALRNQEDNPTSAEGSGEDE